MLTSNSDKIIQWIILGYGNNGFNGYTPQTLEGIKLLLDAWRAQNQRYPSKFSPSYLPDGTTLGNGNGLGCTTTIYNPSNMPNNQIQVDPSTGAVTWNIVPDRLGSSYAVQLTKVFVRTYTGNIGSVTIIPYTGQINGQFVQLNPTIGQANSDILCNYNQDIVYFVIIMYPSYYGSPIDPAQINVNVDYCLVQNIPSYYPQNGIGVPLNQQPGMFTLFFFLFIHWLYSNYLGIIYSPSYQQQGASRTVVGGQGIHKSFVWIIEIEIHFVN